MQRAEPISATGCDLLLRTAKTAAGGGVAAHWPPPPPPCCPYRTPGLPLSWRFAQCWMQRRVHGRCDFAAEFGDGMSSSRELLAVILL